MDVSYQLLARRLARQWQLTDGQYQALLALLPDAASQLEEIDTTLQQLFGHNPMLATLWMTTPNKAFANLSPMALLEREGMAGLQRVSRFLCLQR